MYHFLVTLSTTYLGMEYFIFSTSNCFEILVKVILSAMVLPN